MVHQEYIFTEASGAEHVSSVYLSGEWALIDQLDTLAAQHHAIAARPLHPAVYETNEGYQHVKGALVFPPTTPRPLPLSCEKCKSETQCPVFVSDRAVGRGYSH